MQVTVCNSQFKSELHSRTEIVVQTTITFFIFMNFYGRLLVETNYHCEKNIDMVISSLWHSDTFKNTLFIIREIYNYYRRHFVWLIKWNIKLLYFLSHFIFKNINSKTFELLNRLNLTLPLWTLYNQLTLIKVLLHVICPSC